MRACISSRVIISYMRRLLLLVVLLAGLPVQAQRLGISAPGIGFGGRHFGGGHFGGFISGQAAFGLGVQDAAAGANWIAMMVRSSSR